MVLFILIKNQLHKYVSIFYTLNINIITLTDWMTDFIKPIYNVNQEIGVYIYIYPKI